MRHYVGYHNVNERGEYRPSQRTGYSHLSGFSRKRLEKLIGQTLWIITGTREQGTMIYRLGSVYTPTSVEPADAWGFSVRGREGITFHPPVELNGFSWFRELWNEQRNFSLGMNQIGSPTVIDQLLEIRSQHGKQMPG